MVAKIDQKKHGGRVKGAGDVPAKASGAGPVQSNKTPSPDVISSPRASHSGYGMNAYAGPSSLTPNQDSNLGVSQLAANMKQAGERGSDPVLDAVIQKGVGAGGIDPLTGDAVTMVENTAGTQIRKIGDKNVPDHPSAASYSGAFGNPAGARSRQPSSK